MNVNEALADNAGLEPTTAQLNENFLALSQHFSDFVENTSDLFSKLFEEVMSLLFLFSSDVSRR